MQKSDLWTCRLVFDYSAAEHHTHKIKDWHGSIRTPMSSGWLEREIQ